MGSASDRLVQDQERLWQQAGIAPSFVVQKHHLATVKDRFPGAWFAHIGDGFGDATVAAQSGFLFLHVNTLSAAQWLDLEAFFASFEQGGVR